MKYVKLCICVTVNFSRFLLPSFKLFPRMGLRHILWNSLIACLRHRYTLRHHIHHIQLRVTSPPYPAPCYSATIIQLRVTAPPYPAPGYCATIPSSVLLRHHTQLRIAAPPYPAPDCCAIISSSGLLRHHIQLRISGPSYPAPDYCATVFSFRLLRHNIQLRITLPHSVGIGINKEYTVYAYIWT